MIVLDTHTWVWWVSGSKALSAPAAERIQASMGESRIHVSSISCWEVALLVTGGRLELTMGTDDWIRRSEGLSFVRFVPADNRIATRAVALPEPLHRDPADRIIVATALSLGATLITRDRRLLEYPHVQTLW